MSIPLVCVRAPHAFVRPKLDSWSIRHADVAEVTGSARADYERELRISALGMLMCSPAATSLWRRICMADLYREIRSRSADQRVAIELALAKAMR